MKKNLWFIVAVLTCVAISGVLAVRAADGDDPLVTLSYLNDVIMPQVNKNVEKAIEAKKSQFESEINDIALAQIAAVQQQIQEVTTGTDISDRQDIIDAAAKKVIEELSTTTSSSGDGMGTFVVITVPNGKTLVCDVGAELILRIGSATCIATGTPGLIDLSTSAQLENGGALIQNHYYLCTIAGRGVKAVSGDMKIMVRGKSTIE